MPNELRKMDLEQAMAGFRPGLYRHYKTGGLYLATGIVEHEPTHEQHVVYRSIEYGKDWSRPLASEKESAWTDQVEWPALPTQNNNRRNWPYGSWAPRFTLVAPFRFLLLVNGPPVEGASEALLLSREIEGVEASLLIAGAMKTIRILKSVVRVPVVPLWVSNAEHDPPAEHVRLLNGPRDILLGQLYGVLACVDPNVTVETAGPPIVQAPEES